MYYNMHYDYHYHYDEHSCFRYCYSHTVIIVIVISCCTVFAIDSMLSRAPLIVLQVTIVTMMISAVFAIVVEWIVMMITFAIGPVQRLLLFILMFDISITAARKLF